MVKTTESVILDSFLNLLQRRPLNKITVKDIVEDCGINRNTFYYHFEGVHELLERLMKMAADHIVNYYRCVPSLEACLSEMMTLAQDYSQAVLHIYRSGFRELYERYLLEVCGHLASAYIESLCHDARIDGEIGPRSFKPIRASATGKSSTGWTAI